MPNAAAMPALPPGFRFHPTDEELIVHYLTRQAASMACPVPIIAEVNIYKCNPWDLPAKAVFGGSEWFFFSPRDRKYPNGARPNRAAGAGYWKATGTDKAILSTPTSQNIGVKKALVFYRGKPPKGVKTDWIMHEYRLTATEGNRSTKRRGSSSSSSMRLDDWVLCRIHKKCSNMQQFQLSANSDQEQEEGSTVEEDSVLNFNGTASPKSELAAADQLRSDMAIMTKSCSLTDLLNSVDYAALSQLLLDAPPPADHYHQPPPQSPLIYTQHHHPSQTLNYNNSNMNSHVIDDHDYAHNHHCNGLKRKRSVADIASRSLEDGSDFAKKPPQLPSDSRIGGFGSSSSSYCNQQVAETGLQYSSNMLIHPFLMNQQLLLNNHHLQM